jgi:hypothetical protein
MKTKSIGEDRSVNSLSTDSEGEKKTIKIPPPRFHKITCTIKGTAPFVSNKMPASVVIEMKEAIQKSGTEAKKKRPARDLEKLYRESMHSTAEGWAGIPTNALKQAMIRACKITGFEMTDGKMALVVQPQAVSLEGIPLLRLRGEPQKLVMPVQTKGLPNISARAQWKEWQITDLTIEFDRDIFQMQDVANLLERAGKQVGLGAGRPFSQTSCGMGWGTFEVLQPILY